MKSHCDHLTASADQMSDQDKCKVNYKDHYHLEERNTTALNIMSGVKSLVCDLNGIIIAEMVYRCMICDVIYETIPDVQIHYQTKHIDCDPHSTTPKAKHASSTTLSFFDSLDSVTDRIVHTPEPPVPQTLTFDVPSGLKTLQQQFGRSDKETHKRKSKSLLSAESKSKMGFNNKSKVMGQTSASTFKSGFITCEICGATKFYKYTQRRFGVYSCVGCAKFYSKYLLKPVTYMCENLGKCNLKVSECEPNGRCKACLVHKCQSKFVIDPKKVGLQHCNKIGSLLSPKQTKSVNKIKTKQTIARESNHLRPQSASESKQKNSSSATKTKSETDCSLTKNEATSSKSKPKLDKTKLKNNEKTNVSNKKNPSSPVIPKVKKNNLKNSPTKSISSKQIRSQTCGKCLAFKKNDCNCNTGTVAHKVRERDKNQQNSVKQNRFTRSRNK